MTKLDRFDYSIMALLVSVVVFVAMCNGARPSLSSPPTSDRPWAIRCAEPKWCPSCRCHRPVTRFACVERRPRPPT